MKPSYICIDASNLLHRYFHGMPALFSQKAGIHTHALTAWINLFTYLHKRMPFLPENIQPVVFFDSKRDLLSEGIITEGGDTEGGEKGVKLNYKGNRKPTDPILKTQLQLAVEVTKILGIPYVKVEGDEADTLLGSFVLTERKKAESIYILTSDKDMLQLVDDNVFCLHSLPRSEYKILDAEAVEAKMGVRPDQIADLLVMMGDAVDNIPGIPLIGIKTAQKLLAKYGSLRGVLDNRKEIPGKVGKSICENIGLIPALRKLVTFEEADVPIVYPERNEGAIKSLLTHLEMHKTLQNLVIS